MKEKVTQQIEELLDRAYEAEEPEAVLRLARQILELDEENVDGLVLLADTTEDDDERLRALRHARTLLAPGGGETFDLQSEEASFYVAVLERLASVLLFEAPQEALEVARELMLFDGDELLTLGRPLFYASLLRMERFDEVLERTAAEEKEQDGELTIEAAYARALALFRSQGAGEASAEALLDALGMAPDLPFYLLDFWIEPAEEEDDELFQIAGFFGLAWIDDENSLAWLTRATLALGFLTDRLPEEILEEMKPLLEEAELWTLLEEEKAAIDEGLAENPDMPLEEVDFKALDFLASQPAFLGL